MSDKKRCNWCNLKNAIYVKYHDEEWGKGRFDDTYLFEMLILEGFQAGLSWECILNKRDEFNKVFDDFDWVKIAEYSDEKLEELHQNKGIIRNRRKIIATRKNASVYSDILSEFGSFYSYLRTFWDGDTVIENDKSSSPLSDAISKDLKKRGMSFVGTTIIYSYLQAIGVINSHDCDCFLYIKNGERKNECDKNLHGKNV